MVDIAFPSFLDDNISQDIITLEVGQQKAAVKLFRDILCAASPYFYKALKGNFLESKLETYPLPDVDVHTAKRFQDWLSTRRLPYHSDEDDTPIGSKSCVNCNALGRNCSTAPEGEICSRFDDISDEEDAQLATVINHPDTCASARLYHFADRFDVPLLRQQLIFARWRRGKARFYPSHASMIYVWHNLPSTSPYRSLCRDIFLARWHTDTDYNCNIERKLRQKLPAELLFYILEKLKKQPPKHETSSYIRDICDYHEHNQTPEARSTCQDAKASKRFLRDLIESDDEESLAD